MNWGWNFSGSVLLSWDFPEIKLFEEMNLVIRIDKFREDLSIISQVVNQKLESFSITI